MIRGDLDFCAGAQMSLKGGRWDLLTGRYVYFFFSLLLLMWHLATSTLARAIGHTWPSPPHDHVRDAIPFCNTSILEALFLRRNSNNDADPFAKVKMRKVGVRTSTSTATAALTQRIIVCNQ